MSQRLPVIASKSHFAVWQNRMMLVVWCEVYSSHSRSEARTEIPNLSAKGDVGTVNLLSRNCNGQFNKPVGAKSKCWHRFLHTIGGPRSPHPVEHTRCASSGASTTCQDPSTRCSCANSEPEWMRMWFGKEVFGFTHARICFRSYTRIYTDHNHIAWHSRIYTHNHIDTHTYIIYNSYTFMQEISVPSTLQWGDTNPMAPAPSFSLGWTLTSSNCCGNHRNIIFSFVPSKATGKHWFVCRWGRPRMTLGRLNRLDGKLVGRNCSGWVSGQARGVKSSTSAQTTNWRYRLYRHVRRPWTMPGGSGTWKPDSGSSPMSAKYSCTSKRRSSGKQTSSAIAK